MVGIERFHRPHTCESNCALPLEVLEMWNVANTVGETKTDNGCDIVTGVSRLCTRICPETNYFHVRYISHDLNLAVKDCLNIVRDKIRKIITVSNCIRASIKRLDIYEKMNVKLGSKERLPGLYVDTRWSSTFHMVKKAYKARRVINTVISVIYYFFDYSLSDTEWSACENECSFLDFSASITKNQ